MEFLKIGNKRSFLSELIYILLNIALAVAVLTAVWVAGTAWPALLLILLSKWRILAVRPRYWFANIQANLVDLIVSIGLVVLILAADQVPIAQMAITSLYLGWLLGLKPRSSHKAMTLQASAALIVGTTALFTVAYSWPASITVIIMWLIGYSTVRHVLSARQESELSLYSLIGGLVAAELGWLFFHWTQAYSIPGAGNLQIPQATIVMGMLAFAVERVYQSHKRHGKVDSHEVVLPVLLSVSVILVVTIAFNTVSVG